MKFSEAIQERKWQPAAEVLSKKGFTGLKDELLPGYLADLRVKPNFVREHDPSFAEMRRKLNSESGLIICNHPSMIETPLILSALERDDLKAVVNKKIYEKFEQSFPGKANQYFIPAEASHIRSVLRHIENGGVVLLYPSGGDPKNKRKNAGAVVFEPGFNFILQRLDPQKMVYCFNINEEDVEGRTSRNPSVIVPFVSDEFLPQAANIRNLQQVRDVKMDEVYTRAEQWQANLANLDKGDYNRALTAQYQILFSKF